MDSCADNNIAKKLADSAVVELNFHPEMITLAARPQAIPQTSEFATERDSIAHAVPKRCAEFYAGRNLARIALQRLGMTACALPRNVDRSPRWPSGVRGSISHTDDLVMVAVTVSQDLAGVGIDIEKIGSVDADLRPMIHADECEAELDNTLLFSAKEALFKAVHPICGEFLEFADATILLSNRSGEFKARGRSNLISSTFIERGMGRFMHIDNWVITGFWINNRDNP